jgi:hypothetical protein
VRWHRVRRRRTMAIKGRDRYENLSAVKVAADGSVDYGLPYVRFGDFMVPSIVAWVSEPIGVSPSVRAEFEMRKGLPVCLSVTFTAAQKGRPITTADLESIPGLERKGLDAFKALGTRVVDNTPEDFQVGGLVQTELVIASIERKSQGMYPNPKDVTAALKKRSDDELERVAAIYRDNRRLPCASGESKVAILGTNGSQTY